MEKLIFEVESFQIRGAVFEVYKELGSGFLENVYQECLVREFERAGVPHIAQPELLLSYKGKTLQQYFKPDFICFEKIIVELKSVKHLCDEHRAQMLNYLKASGYTLGFLVNFDHHPKAEIERILL